MKIKLKKINPLGLLAIGFVIGLIAMYLFVQPKLTAKGKTADFWENLSNQYESYYDKLSNYDCTQNDVKSFLKEFEPSNNKPYRWYLTGEGSLACRKAFEAYHTYQAGIPTPTPIVEYRTQTQYVEQPAPPQSTSSNCRPDYAGGMYCTSNTGVQTHCTSNYAGGFNCN